MNGTTEHKNIQEIPNCTSFENFEVLSKFKKEDMKGNFKAITIGDRKVISPSFDCTISALNIGSSAFISTDPRKHNKIEITQGHVWNSTFCLTGVQNEIILPLRGDGIEVINEIQPPAQNYKIVSLNPDFTEKYYFKLAAKRDKAAVIHISHFDFAKDMFYLGVYKKEPNTSRFLGRSGMKDFICKEAETNAENLLDMVEAARNFFPKDYKGKLTFSIPGKLDLRIDSVANIHAKQKAFIKLPFNIQFRHQ